MKQGLTLARDDDGFYGFFADDPYKNKWGDWGNDNYRMAADKFCPEDFRLIFGCRLVRKGRKKRIKRILIELED